MKPKSNADNLRLLLGSHKDIDAVKFVGQHQDDVLKDFLAEEISSRYPALKNFVQKHIDANQMDYLAFRMRHFSTIQHNPIAVRLLQEGSDDWRLLSWYDTGYWVFQSKWNSRQVACVSKTEPGKVLFLRDDPQTYRSGTWMAIGMIRGDEYCVTPHLEKDNQRVEEFFKYLDSTPTYNMRLEPLVQVLEGFKNFRLTYIDNDFRRDYARTLRHFIGEPDSNELGYFVERLLEEQPLQTRRILESVEKKDRSGVHRAVMPGRFEPWVLQLIQPLLNKPDQWAPWVYNQQGQLYDVHWTSSGYDRAVIKVTGNRELEVIFNRESSFYYDFMSVGSASYRDGQWFMHSSFCQGLPEMFFKDLGVVPVEDKEGKIGDWSHSFTEG